MSRWCSAQNAFVTPERRKFRRIHGLQLPWHPQQVVGWIVIVVIAVNTFAVLTPLLQPPSLRSALSISIATIFVAHLCSHLTVLLLDPADPRVRSQPANKVLPEFDRARHARVIENGRCHLCNITTDSKRTKHCSICNKCIVRFDHHCKWLNNCIGARNYTAFLVCLISAILASLFVAGLSATELLLSLLPERIADYRGLNATMENATAASPALSVIPVPDTASMILITAIGILSAIAAILLIHLCFFHGYIACLGLTTYEYVRIKRERNAVAAAVAAAAAATATAAAAAAVAATATANSNASFAADPAESATAESDAGASGDATIRQSGCRVASCFASKDWCSSHEKRITTEVGSIQATAAISNLCSRTSERKNFRLCFSYELESGNAIEASVESSSRVSSVREQSRVSQDLTDGVGSSTPSPVSCCFANSIAGCCRSNSKAESKKRSSGNESLEAVHASRNCDTVERIGKFLRTYLRRNGRRRSSNSEVARAARNKVVPSVDTSRVEVKMDLEDSAATPDLALQSATESLAVSVPSRPPIKLPPLRSFTDPSPLTNQTLNSIGSSMKRPASHARPRRTSTFRKRPRLKTNSRVTQSIQLSPILESELSKPASPRSPRSPLSLRSPCSSCSPRSPRFVRSTSPSPRFDKFVPPPSSGL